MGSFIAHYYFQTLQKNMHHVHCFDDYQTLRPTKYVLRENRARTKTSGGRVQALCHRGASDARVDDITLIHKPALIWMF